MSTPMPILSSFRRSLLLTCVLATVLVASNASARPVPIGTSSISVSYTTDAGLQTFSGSRNYLGVGPVSATNLGAAPNITAFNSSNEFGRRVTISHNPQFANVFHSDETIITNAFFKKLGQEGSDFFPGITEDSNITVNITGEQFDRPVNVDTNTLLLHVLWNDQADQLNPPYHHLHNVHTYSANFRELDEFHQAGELAEHPAANFALADKHIDWNITGEGTDTLSVSATFPYHLLRSLEEAGHGGHAVPEGLPAPHGFLEPFHFHIEYAVTPEPGALVMLAFGAWAVYRKRSSHPA